MGLRGFPRPIEMGPKTVIPGAFAPQPMETTP
jgi:hypothetical protein